MFFWMCQSQQFSCGRQAFLDSTQSLEMRNVWKHEGLHFYGLQGLLCLSRSLSYCSVMLSCGWFPAFRRPNTEGLRLLTRKGVASRIRTSRFATAGHRPAAHVPACGSSASQSHTHIPTMDRAGPHKPRQPLRRGRASAEASMQPAPAVAHRWRPAGCPGPGPGGRLAAAAGISVPSNPACCWMTCAGPRRRRRPSSTRRRPGARR